jgi:hypothetical protein
MYDENYKTKGVRGTYGDVIRVESISKMWR